MSVVSQPVQASNVSTSVLLMGLNLVIQLQGRILSTIISIKLLSYAYIYFLHVSINVQLSYEAI